MHAEKIVKNYFRFKIFLLTPNLSNDFISEKTSAAGYDMTKT